MGIAFEMKLLRQVWSRRNRIKRPAVFFDRDGTLIEYHELVRSNRQIRPLKGVAGTLKELAERGYLLVVVTNKPDIERGETKRKDAMAMNAYMRELFAKKGGRIDAIYSCPHRFQSNCACKKPKLGMIRAAQKDFNIDMEKSWLVGDTGRDMETGKRARVRTIKVEGGDPDTHFATMGDFAVKRLSEVPGIILR